MIYEANVLLVDGRTVCATVEANSRQDAKYEFAHFPYVEVDGQRILVNRPDFRSVKKAKDQADEAFKDALE